MSTDDAPQPFGVLGDLLEYDCSLWRGVRSLGKRLGELGIQTNLLEGRECGNVSCEVSRAGYILIFVDVFFCCIWVRRFFFMGCVGGYWRRMLGAGRDL
jgi:hypothetical protein